MYSVCIIHDIYILYIYIYLLSFILVTSSYLVKYNQATPKFQQHPPGAELCLLADSVFHWYLWIRNQHPTIRCVNLKVSISIFIKDFPKYIHMNYSTYMIYIYIIIQQLLQYQLNRFPSVILPSRDSISTMFGALLLRYLWLRGTTGGPFSVEKNGSQAAFRRVD